MTPKDLTIVKEGAQLFKGGLSQAELTALESALAAQPQDAAGVRLSGIPDLRPFLAADGPIGRIPASVLGAECVPVRAILFDKSAEQNWSLGWHQDRTIAVKQRIDIDGFGPWSIKSGMVHVEPPFDLLASMVTVRVHLDAVPVTNAPLLIAPGSHKRARIPTAEIPDVVRQCGVFSCLAAAGDIWLYATPILHASEAAAEPRHRRVLQVDYAVGELPGGLQWLGV
ncbi:MAG: phytanoyl-CoA dioxygenase family protein [Alphaproteobacteria bacterium]